MKFLNTYSFTPHQQHQSHHIEGITAFPNNLTYPQLSTLFIYILSVWLVSKFSEILLNSEEANLLSPSFSPKVLLQAEEDAHPYLNALGFGDRRQYHSEQVPSPITSIETPGLSAEHTICWCDSLDVDEKGIKGSSNASRFGGTQAKAWWQLWFCWWLWEHFTWQSDPLVGLLLDQQCCLHLYNVYLLHRWGRGTCGAYAFPTHNYCVALGCINRSHHLQLRVGLLVWSFHQFWAMQDVLHVFMWQMWWMINDWWPHLEIYLVLVQSAYHLRGQPVIRYYPQQLREETKLPTKGPPAFMPACSDLQKMPRIYNSQWGQSNYRCQQSGPQKPLSDTWCEWNGDECFLVRCA